MIRRSSFKGNRSSAHFALNALYIVCKRTGCWSTKYSKAERLQPFRKNWQVGRFLTALDVEWRDDEGSGKKKVDKQGKFINDPEELSGVAHRTNIVHAKHDPINDERELKKLITTLDEDDVKAYVVYAKECAVACAVTEKIQL